MIQALTVDELHDILINADSSELSEDERVLQFVFQVAGEIHMNGFQGIVDAFRSRISEIPNAFKAIGEKAIASVFENFLEHFKAARCDEDYFEIFDELDDEVLEEYDEEYSSVSKELYIHAWEFWCNNRGKREG